MNIEDKPATYCGVKGARSKCGHRERGWAGPASDIRSSPLFRRESPGWQLRSQKHLVSKRYV